MKFKFTFDRKPSYTAFSVAIAVLLLSYRFLYSPTLSALSGTFREMNTKMNDIKREARLAVNRGILANQSNRMKLEFDNYQKRISSDSSPNKMLEELTAIAESLRINIIGVEPLPVVKNEIAGVAGYYAQMPLRIRLRCGYHEFGRFIARIERSAILMKIERLSMRDDPKDIWRHDIDLTVSAYAYTAESK